VQTEFPGNQHYQESKRNNPLDRARSTDPNSFRKKGGTGLGLAISKRIIEMARHFELPALILDFVEQPHI